MPHGQSPPKPRHTSLRRSHQTCSAHCARRHRTRDISDHIQQVESVMRTGGGLTERILSIRYEVALIVQSCTSSLSGRFNLPKKETRAFLISSATTTSQHSTLTLRRCLELTLGLGQGRFQDLDRQIQMQTDVRLDSFPLAITSQPPVLEASSRRSHSHCFLRVEPVHHHQPHGG